MLGERTLRDQIGQSRGRHNELPDLDIHAVRMGDRRASDVHPAAVRELGRHDRVRLVDSPTGSDKKLIGNAPNIISAHDNVRQLFDSVAHNERPFAADHDDLLNQWVLEKVGKESKARHGGGHRHGSTAIPDSERVRTLSGRRAAEIFRFTPRRSSTIADGSRPVHLLTAATTSDRLRG